MLLFPSPVPMFSRVLKSSAVTTTRFTSIKATSNTTKYFHTTTANMVKVGDSIPDITLFEGNPGDKVNLAEVLKSGKGIILGVPAAFSPSCSESHIPGYINSEKTKNAGQVFVVSVNDAFVMKAWGKALEPSNASGLRYLADPDAKFTKALEVDFDASAILGNFRSKRYALTTEDGKITKVAIEPDNIGVDVSAVDKVLA